MYDIVEADDVVVLQLLHQRNLSNCGRWRAFFTVQVDFLERYQLSGLAVSPFEDLYKSVKWTKEFERTDAPAKVQKWIVRIAS